MWVVFAASSQVSELPVPLLLRLAWSLLESGGDLVGPGAGSLVGRRCLQHFGLGAARADDVQADGQAARGEAAGDAGGGLASHVDGIGEGDKPPLGTNLLAANQPMAACQFPGDGVAIVGERSRS